MPGPLPKRIEERRRRNAVPGETVVEMAGEVVPPELPKMTPAVHPVAAGWYESLKASGQSLYFEPSDWAAAVVVTLAMSKNLRAKRFSGELFGQVWGAMNDLLTTEAARRRARIQVRRMIDGVEEPEAPTALDEYRKMVGG